METASITTNNYNDQIDQNKTMVNSSTPTYSQVNSTRSAQPNEHSFIPNKPHNGNNNKSRKSSDLKQDTDLNRFSSSSSSNQSEKTIKNDDKFVENDNNNQQLMIDERNGFKPNNNTYKKTSYSGLNDKKKKQTINKSKSNFNNANNNNQRFNSNKNRSGYSINNDSYGVSPDSPVFANSNNGYAKTGSKKTNLNHLLNFTYESARDSNENYYEYEKFTRQFWSMKLSKNSYFSKEQFLQANCQFVVKNTGDYSVHLCDPDLLVDWEKIEEIQIDSHEEITCPICLYPPQAGKMTKCGHVFCWSCILHYLSLSDKSWRKCPICYESIYKNDLKSLRSIKHAHEYKTGEELTLNLMFKCKNKYNTIILPIRLYDNFLQDENGNKPVTFNTFSSDRYSDCRQYFKLHIKTPSEIYEQVLKRERDELNKQVEEEKNQPEVCFVHEALQMLDEREQNLKANILIRKNNSTKSNEEEVIGKPSEIDEEIKSKLPVSEIKANLTYSDAFTENIESKSNDLILASRNPSISNDSSDTKLSEEEIVESKEQPDLNEEFSLNEKANSAEMLTSNSKLSNQNLSTNSDYSYFYQAADGQRVYINALNSRCLISEYSAFSSCPTSIKGRIVACDSFFMTEENRKRYKYLSHLPLHSEFKIVELDLREPYLSKKTIELFEDEINERKRMRIRKEKREKIHSERAAAAADSTLSHPHYYVPSAMYGRENSESIVDYSSEFPEASSSPPASSGASTSGVSSASSNNNGSNSTSSDSSNNSQQFSFAQMLKHSNNDLPTSKNSNKNNLTLSAWPTLDSNANPNNNSSQLTNGWLNMVKQQQQSFGRTKKYQDAPSPWVSNSSATKITGYSNDLQDNGIEIEEDDSAPAPLYQQSFFSAIDESLKLIESKKSSSDFLENDAKLDEKPTQKEQTKKKKKTKQLLFSTSMNMGTK